jgi:hypothetical protein
MNAPMLITFVHTYRNDAISVNECVLGESFLHKYGSSVSVTTGYGLDGLGSITGGARDTYISRLYCF